MVERRSLPTRSHALLAERRSFRAAPRIRVSALGTVALGLLALSCSDADFFGSLDPEKPPALSKMKPENGGTVPDSKAASVEDWSHIPVPPADAPKIAPIQMKAPVYARPDRQSPTIGYARVGTKLSRSSKPVSQRDCKDGWYAVRPVGFACAGDRWTTRLNNPIVRAIAVEPDRGKPMPYSYAFVRSVAPNYLRIPSKKEQFASEMRLDRHLRNWKKLSYKWDKLDVGANDVPLNKEGHAVGAIPDEATPQDMSHRFGGDGTDVVPWWLEGERRIPNLSHFKVPPYALFADRIKRKAGLALIGTFVAGKKAQDRRFAVSTDGRLVPADKLKAGSGSPYHGHDIREHGLPVAFARKAGARWWDVSKGKLKKAERLGWREFIPLTGTVKRIQGVRMVETRNGRWLRSKDLKTAMKPSRVPSWAKRGARWIDISIVSQTMVLWEGDKPVYATLVSTGRGGYGDPKKTLATPQGTFSIYQKHVTTTMDSDAADSEFELRDVPWVMYFKGGYAIHGAFWHDDFGRTRSHGCINVAPIDARFVFHWATPQVPNHWHSAYTEGKVFEDGTRVHIHK